MLTRFTTAMAACLLAVVMLSIGGEKSASAKVYITERIKYYNVTGKTGRQLFRSIDRRGPKLSRNNHAIATAAYKHRFKNVKTAVKGSNCVVTSADLHVQIVYTYPRWRNRKRASAKLRKTWDQFMARVEKHEKSHGRIYREYARQLHKLMHGLKGRTSKGCKDFGKTSKRMLGFAERRHARRHNSLDRRDGWVSSRIRRLQARLLKTN